MSYMNNRTTLTLVSAALAGAIAVGWTADATALDCRAAKTQREIEECAATGLADANAQLERAYTKHVGALEGEDRERLVQAERAWEHYRDLDCRAAEGVYAGGTMAATEVAACKARLARERLAELERIYAEPPAPGAPAPK